MKLKCLQCEHEFEGGISLDELGWHSLCPECGGSFDVDVPEGKIVMAFTDPVDDEDDDENRYKYFTDDFTGEYVHTYYAFDTAKEFINKWLEIYDEPNGMWYWVLDNGHCICSGACDPMDIDIFAEHFGMACDVCGKYHHDIRVDKTLKEKFNIEAKICLDCYAWFDDNDRYDALFDNGIIDDDVYAALVDDEEEDE